MKNHFWLGLIFILPLLSCELPNKEPSYAFGDDETLPYFNRNGTAFSIADDSSDYHSSTVVASSDSLIGKIKDGEQIMLLVISDNCSHCTSDEPTIVKWIHNSKSEVYLVDFTDYASGETVLSTLSGAFPNSNYSSVLSGATPSIYFIETSLFAEQIDFYDTLGTETVFENFMEDRLNHTDIYDFRDFASYGQYAKEKSGLVYLYSEGDATAKSFYLDHLRPLARHDEKNLALISYDDLSEQDKQSYLTRFGLSVYAPIIAEYEVGNETPSASYDVSTSLDEATGLLDSFYYETLGSSSISLSPTSASATVQTAGNFLLKA